MRTVFRDVLQLLIFTNVIFLPVLCYLMYETWACCNMQVRILDLFLNILTIKINACIGMLKLNFIYTPM